MIHMYKKLHYLNSSQLLPILMCMCARTHAHTHTHKTTCECNKIKKNLFTEEKSRKMYAMKLYQIEDTVVDTGTNF